MPKIVTCDDDIHKRKTQAERSRKYRENRNKNETKKCQYRNNNPKKNTIFFLTTKPRDISSVSTARVREHRNKNIASKLKRKAQMKLNGKNHKLKKR